MKAIRCEIVTDHNPGLLIWHLPAVPSVGDHIRVVDAHSPGHDDDLDRAERVRSVLWHQDGALTIVTDCEPYE